MNLLEHKLPLLIIVLIISYFSFVFPTRREGSRNSFFVNVTIGMVAISLYFTFALYKGLTGDDPDALVASLVTDSFCWMFDSQPCRSRPHALDAPASLEAPLNYDPEGSTQPDPTAKTDAAGHDINSVVMVRQLQTALRDTHCYSGPLDGILGEDTLSAIKNFNGANRTSIPSTSITNDDIRLIWSANSQPCSKGDQGIAQLCIEFNFNEGKACE